MKTVEGTSLAESKALWSLIEHRCEAAPDAIALIDGDTRITYAEFRALCCRTTALLQSEGVVSGDRVAVWLVNRVEWLALLFALARIGAMLVSVNTRYRSEEVSHILEKSGARSLVLQPNFRKIDFAGILAGMAASSMPALEKIIVIDGADQTAATLLGRPVVPFETGPAASQCDGTTSDPDDGAILFTTSGTTKGPKLVMHPQRTLVDHAWHCARAYGLDKPDAVMLAMLPFCGVFGLNGALAALAGGAPVVLMETFDGPAAAQLIQRHRVTHTFGSDEMYSRVMGAVPDARPFPCARFFGFGAFTSSFAEDARQAWKRDIPLFGLYGSSEVLALFSAQPANLPINARIEGGGMPAAGDAARIRIRDTDSGKLLPAGQSGEIEILAPSNFLGYFNDPDATAAAVHTDGYFRTGDLGHLREDGTFVYETRMGDAIRLGGFLVNPVEIEEVLKRLAGVADAQVVAVEIDGQMRVVAFVVRTDDAQPSENELIERTRALVAPFKVPARIWFVDAYPVTLSSNGVKTQRNKLRETAIERMAQR